MKKILFFMALCIALISCQDKKDEPDAPITQTDQPTQMVKFNVQGMSMTTTTMNAPRKSTILDDEGGQALTDLYVFDGSTQLVHQVYADDNAAFGTVTLELSHGNHNLSFICTSSTGITVENGIMTFTSIRPTFGKLLALNVSSSTPAQNLELDRITSRFYITINDEFPAIANQIEFILANKYNQINVASLLGVNGAEWSQKVSCTGKVGQSGVQYNFSTICPSLTEEYTSDLTINVYNSLNAVIYTVTIEDVRFAANTKTLLSGNLFTSPSANVSINTTWHSNIEGTW